MYHRHRHQHRKTLGRAVLAVLPAGLLARTGLELGQVLQLGMALCPDVARLVEGIRSSMQD